MLLTHIMVKYRVDTYLYVYACPVLRVQVRYICNVYCFILNCCIPKYIGQKINIGVVKRPLSIQNFCR